MPIPEQTDLAPIIKAAARMLLDNGNITEAVVQTNDALRNRGFPPVSRQRFRRLLMRPGAADLSQKDHERICSMLTQHLGRPPSKGRAGGSGVCSGLALCGECAAVGIRSRLTFRRKPAIYSCSAKATGRRRCQVRLAWKNLDRSVCSFLQARLLPIDHKTDNDIEGWQRRARDRFAEIRVFNDRVEFTLLDGRSFSVKRSATAFNGQGQWLPETAFVELARHYSASPA